MKKIFTTLGGLTFFLLYMINGCKKDGNGSASSPSFTEEFKDVYKLQTSGWIANDPSNSGGGWTQGIENSTDKAGIPIGFPAFSYSNTKDEYVCAYDLYTISSLARSTWFITPTIFVKNGDKISFYSRADTSTTAADRMQVRMSNGSADVGNGSTTVGDFTSVLFDINSGQSIGGYPTVWTKYEYTFIGMDGVQKIRIAFRYYVPANVKSKMIGVDQFSFEAK